jgi:hypothetical protein
MDDLQAAPFPTQDGVLRDPHVGQRDVRVVGRHVEGPEVLLDLEALGVFRDQEGRDPEAISRLPAGPREDEIGLGPVHSRVPGLLAVDDPLVTLAGGARLHVRGVRTMGGLGDAEGEPALAVGQVVDPLRLLSLGAVLQHQQQAHVVADDRVFVLKIAV